MSLIKNFFEYRNLVCPIDGRDADAVGISPDHLTGEFLPNRKQELIDFCAKNSGYHIASALDYFTTVNKFCEDAKHYFLCTGDSNPEIIFFDEGVLISMRKSDLAEFCEEIDCSARRRNTHNTKFFPEKIDYGSINCQP